MEMKNLENELKNKYNKLLTNSLKELETPEGLKNALSFHGRKYIKNEKELLNKYIIKQYEKRLNTELTLLTRVNKIKPYKIGNKFSITICWAKSRMWGNNPQAELNIFKGEIGEYKTYKSDRITGCGYCKESTATAEVLNQDAKILHDMYKIKNNANIKEKNTHDINTKLFGYGSGYNELPKFEGGVGITCHIDILKKLGFEVEHISNTTNTDTYLITKVKVV